MDSSQLPNAPSVHASAEESQSSMEIMENKRVTRSATSSNQNRVAENVDGKLAESEDVKLGIPIPDDSSMQNNKRVTTSAASNARKLVEKLTLNSEIEVAESESEASIKKQCVTATQVIISTGDDKKSLEECVFSNDYLLWTIFKSLGFKDLKCVRQVNRLCNVEATKLLWKKFVFFPIEVKHDIVKLPDPMSPSSYPFKIAAQKCIKGFSKLVSRSPRFPCNSFFLRGSAEQLLIKGNFSTFFQTHGHLLKLGQIIFRANALTETGLLAVVTFLGKFLPNLENLYIHYDQSFEYSSPLPYLKEFHIIKLNKLKTFNTQHDVPIELLRSILSNAPNLEKIYWKHLDYSDSLLNSYQSLVDLDAIRLLKNVNFFFENGNVQAYEKMLEQNPKFEQIEQIRFDKEVGPMQLQRASKVLTELLHGSSETATGELNLSFLGHAVNLKLPAFPNILHVSVIYDHINRVEDQIPVLLPPGTKFADLFPNLLQFSFQHDLFFSIEEGNFFPIFYEPLTPLLTVKYLWIKLANLDTMPVSWIAQFCALFPNATHASFPVIGDSALELVWSNFPRLEDLSFAFPVDVEDYRYYRKLDSAFTGFSQETVNELYCKQATNFQMSDVDVKALSVKPSIADLKNLKKLSLRFTDKKCINFDAAWEKAYRDIVFDTSVKQRNIFMVDGNIMMSHVTTKFLFEMCPLLNKSVNVTFQEVTYVMNT